MSPISCDLFRKRLLVLTVRSPVHGLPRRRRDRDILLKAIALSLPRHQLTERQLNEALLRWLEDEGRTIDLDHVTLRRELVDTGYLERRPDGSSYLLQARASLAPAFEEGIDAIDVGVLIAAERDRLEQRRKAAQ